MADKEKRSRGLFKRKPKDPANPGRIAQMREVFKLARKHYPALPWIMLAAVAGITLVGVLIGLLLPPVWLWGILGFMGGIVFALWILGRYAEKAAFAEMRGKPGAIGAVLNSARRSWLMDEQPIAVDPRTKDMVFRSTGRGGVVLVSEGPANRTYKMLEKERKRHERVLPNVPVTIIQAGDGKDQVPMDNLVSTVHKLPRKLHKDEVLAVRKRLSSLGSMTSRPPIPKGIDPNRARPDRRAIRGR
ncbi:hypothetical protein HMPREF0183_1642 [Brevibacterium mcbrellneri ATCC 49030]|uniref:DUF4191 domain-containing protein n=1 Tax=Brevibacterium mcbrellneri ATCC 49030 TaxID=585530 RepID=D4YNY2_9MICO|nr:DUF4191 domain-containing protein [Brevibacterium mcbrellneri]EFG47122.1 hypothetical protein HMPREF0183_1642 [Brevibacterium mcbrellneri ATCC 49030]